MEGLGEAARLLQYLVQRRRAYGRARRLLRAHLTPEQRACLKTNAYVVVRGNVSGDEYQVWGGQVGVNVVRVKDGARYCFYPRRNQGCLPHPDVMLGQVLVLRHNEQWLLRHVPRPFRRFGR